MLQHSVEGINKHTGILKSLIEQAGGQSKPQHCKGMEGLDSEARKHASEEAPQDGKLRDVVIIAQYQRMATTVWPASGRLQPTPRRSASRTMSRS